MTTSKYQTIEIFSSVFDILVSTISTDSSDMLSTINCICKILNFSTAFNVEQ